MSRMIDCRARYLQIATPMVFASPSFDRSRPTVRIARARASASMSLPTVWVVACASLIVALVLTSSLARAWQSPPERKHRSSTSLLVASVSDARPMPRPAITLPPMPPTSTASPPPPPVVRATTQPKKKEKANGELPLVPPPNPYDSSS